MTFSSEGIARGEIAAAQAELEVLRVQVRNMESELLAKEEENRSLRQDENTEVAKLKGLIDEKIGGRQQHAQYLNETSARLHEMLQEKDAKLHTLSAQILDFEQSLSGAELECQELKSRLALSTHHTSASDDRVVSMRHSLASLHDTIALRSAQLHNERAAHSRQLQVLSSALVAVEASLLTPLVPSKDAGSPPSSPLPTPGKFSWLTSEACILTIGQQGGGAIPIAQERAFQTRVVLYISVRDAGMRLMRLPESAEILVKGRGCVEDSDHLDDPTEDDTSFRAASTEAATIVEDHQLSLQGYGGLCVHSVTRIARSTWEVSVYVDPHLFNAKTAGSLVGTPLAGPVPNPGAELVTSSALLRKGKSPHRSPPPPPTDKKRVGLRLVAADNVCMSSRTFLVKSGGGVQSAGGYASEEVNARNVEAALRCSDVFVFPDPIIVRYGHEESGGSNPPSPTSLAKLTDTSHVFLKSILTIRDERGRCTSETDLLSRKKEFQAGLKCTVRLPSSASSGLSIATAGMESFIPIECGVLALCKVPLGKYSALQAASPQPLCVDFTWEETAEETQGDGFNDALSAQQAVPTISTNVAVRSSSSGGGFATDVNLRARFIQKFLARGLHAVMTGHRTESRPMDTQTATSTTVPHEGVVGRTLERIASLHKEELLQTLLDDGAVVKKFADEKLEAVSAVETKLEEALLKVDKKEAEVTALHIEMAELRDTDNVAKDEYDNLVAELAVAQAAATASELHSEDHANEIEALQQKHHEEKEELLRRVTEAEENEKSLKRSVEDCSQQMVQMTTASHDSLEGSAKELQAMSQKLSELDANYQAALTELNETCQREESAVAKMAKQRDQLAELQGLCTNTESRFREMMTQNESRVNDTVLTAEANEAVLRAQIATLEEALGNSTRSNGHEMDRLATHIAQLTSSAETSVHDHETQLSEVRARFSDAEEALRGKVQRLEGSLEGMEAEKRRNDTRVRMLTEELDKWETQAQGLATQAEEYSQKVRAAQERIEYLERELESAVTQANAISVEWGRTQTSSDAELTELRTANQALRDSLVTAEEQAKALQAQHEELADDIAHATNRIDSQNAASAEMKAEIATKNTAVARGDKEADRLRNEIQSLESHASALRIDLQGAAARNDVVTGENAQLRDELKSAQRTAEQSAVHVNDLRNNRDIAAAQAEADMEAMEWELKEARAECAREAAQARALETDMDFLLSQVDYAKSALFGVSASYDEVTPTYTSGSGAPAGTRDVAFHALMADHATTVRLLRSDQELQFAKISHLFHNALGALVRNVLIEQSATQKDRIAELKRELTETQVCLIAVVLCDSDCYVVMFILFLF